MFDRQTAQTIRNAPSIDGIPPERLAAELTNAYVQVSVASSLLDDESSSVDGALIDTLLSIAQAQETLSLVLQEPELRQAAAHVAAHAYQVVALNSPSATSSFHPSSIPTSVSSMLLFIASDALPDAEEMTQHLHPSGTTLELILIAALTSLGRADLCSVANLELPEFELPNSTSPYEIAAYVGYYECASQLILMSSALLRVDRGEWNPGGFALIRDRMQAGFNVDVASGTISASDTIAGPWHLATLLDLAEDVLTRSAITGIASTAQVRRADWDTLVERIAKKRPTLWRNHRDAVAVGFLEAGTSAVVTFPTGAGKSTVTELKVAATVLSGRNVLFLVPTLSLLDQQAQALKTTFPDIHVLAQRGIEDVYEITPETGVSVFVMTPESCLASFSANPDYFGDIGLIVFDEAHLLSAVSDIPGRRSIDATLCLLLLSSRFSDADIFLVSAMIGNADSLREWLEELTGRNTLALSDPWKPTRQARGALVYRTQDLERLKALTQSAQATATTKGPPAALKREMTAVPYGFFGLLTTWESSDPRDYRWLPLLNTPVPLSVSGTRTQGGWRLSSNQNQVATALAKSGANFGRKVLVFAQQVGWSVSISNAVNANSDQRTTLDAGEKALLTRAIEAAGSTSVLYGHFDGDEVVGQALPHHGLLLREERRLHEKLYKRRDGIPVLIATSTLAQGMNLPSEIVVIAGDRRFDAETNRLQRLETQELLNAAGRAGRAGMRSNGLVVVIPSYPIGFDGHEQIGPGWFQLQQAFSQADQCVEVTDPVTTLLLREESDETADELNYLIRRLAVTDDPTDFRQLVLRSFGAHQARRSGDTADLDRRLDAVALSMEETQPPWVKRCVASTGLAPADITHIAQSLESPAPMTTDFSAYREWFVTILSSRPSVLESILRSSSRAVFGDAPSELGQEFERLSGENLVTNINVLLEAWMTGSNLQKLQDIGVRLKLCKNSVKCEFARKFVLRVIPDLAYLFGLPWLILNATEVRAKGDISTFSKLSRAVELGVDTSRKLEYLEGSVMRTRIGAHLDAG